MKTKVPRNLLNKKNVKTLASKGVVYKRLFFIIIFGALLIFTADIIYRYAFLYINYISYSESNDFIITKGRISNINLNKMLKNIEEKNRIIMKENNKKYRDPFIFKNNQEEDED